MTPEIALALTLLAAVAILAAITALMLRRLLNMVLDHFHSQAAEEQPTVIWPPEAVPPEWAPVPEERLVDDDTLLPFATSPPAPPRCSQVVQYVEEEDDVPTSLYPTDEEGGVALLADLED